MASAPVASRVSLAASMGAAGTAPAWFSHSQTPNRPAEPSYSSLDAEDQQRYLLWKAQRENGVLLGHELINASSALLAACAAFESYLATSQYTAWSFVDRTSREAQWRLQLVDTITAVDAANTKPPSFDPLGVGTAAPGVGDIGNLGGPPAPGAPESITTGDPNAPDFVFGSDGNIMTVS